MSSKGIKFVFVFLALLTIGQVVWWGYSIIEKQSVITSLLNTPESQRDYQSVQLMIYSEGLVFLIVWILGFYAAYRYYTRELRLKESHQNFLSAVTHELKTPIANMQLSLETLERPDLTEEQKTKYITRAQVANQQLNAQIETILSSTQEGYQPKLQNVSLDDILHVVKESFTEDSHFIHLKKENLPVVKTNPDELQLIIKHLIENALKYTKPLKKDETEVSVFAKSQNSSVDILISDNGPGLGSDELEKVFLPYWRSSHSKDQNIKGTGLGLLLTQSLCERLGIKLDIQSQGENKGVQAKLTLPKGATS